LNTSRISTRTWLLGFLAVLFLLFLGYSLWDLAATTDFGESDFKIYWSAAYLLGRGENPYNIDLVKSVQQAQTGSISNDQIIAWNPPFLFLFLLPVVWLPFTAAKFAWLVINIVMILTAGIMLTDTYLRSESPSVRLIFLLFALVFPAAITGLYMGQVTFLVFWGLVANLALIKKEQWFWAGAALILTSVKPHMVVLPVLYLLVYMARQRKFLGWVGLAFASIACLAILLLFQPAILSNLFGETSVATGRWATTTVGGLLSYLGITEAARFLILIFLPLPVLLARQPERFSVEFSVALLTLITVPTTVFGWSYDQTILLIPIAQVFAWISGSKYKLALIACIGAVTVTHYIQRVLPINEVFYVWIPLFWWLIFAVAWSGARLPSKSYA
jgi:hypothetical protein